MIFITINRILKTAFSNFWRNGWLSLATTSVMVMTIFIMSAIVTINLLSNETMKRIQEKVDISVYFNQEADEKTILDIKGQLENMSEVKHVDYISRDDAWKQFQDRHKDDKAIIESVKELNDNPLYATLNIKAHSLDQYPAIVSFLDQDQFKTSIKNINYEKNKSQIDKLANIINAIRQGGLVVTVVFIIIAILITFNTIRLTIYSYHQEIEIMRLVGASNWYIRAPFIVEGIIYGFFGCVITLLLMYPLVNFTSDRVNGYLPDMDIANYFTTNINTIFLWQLAAGVSVGIISSFIAIRRYLKV